ncbi:MAG: hypothetical protein J5J06_12090 [Phycisphaerae bacterium]|nr:hypothetical protein [Phycisphaerae bacterium]
MRQSGQSFPIVLGGALVLILVGIIGRLIPHAPNFAPIAATALFAGFFLRDFRVALLVPLCSLFVTDLLHSGFYDARIMVVVYAALAMPVAFRWLLGSRWTWIRIGAASLTMSGLFFVMTNLAVWQFSGIYEKSIAGLMQCYSAALPFFRYTVLGDLVWTAGLFGTYALVRRALGAVNRAAAARATLA